MRYRTKLNELLEHKYIKRWYKDDEWHYLYPGDKKDGKKQDVPEETGEWSNVKKKIKSISPQLKKKVYKRPAGKGKSVRLSRNEVFAILKHGQVGLISAGRNPKNAADKKLTDAQIKQRHETLKKELIKKGYVFVPAQGKYEGDEKSFMVMVPNSEKEDLVQLGKQFHQDSVIFSNKDKNEMIYTTGKLAGKELRGSGFADQRDANDYYSEIKTKEGKKLKFQLFFNFDKKFVREGLSLFDALNKIISQLSLSGEQRQAVKKLDFKGSPMVGWRVDPSSLAYLRQELGLSRDQAERFVQRILSGINSFTQ